VYTVKFSKTEKAGGNCIRRPAEIVRHFKRKSPQKKERPPLKLYSIYTPDATKYIVTTN